jgi:hypothetical protein
VVKATPLPLYPRERYPGILCTGGWVGPRAGAENFASTSIRSPDRRARRESLYRIRHPGLEDKSCYVCYYLGSCRQNVPSTAHEPSVFVKVFKTVCRMRNLYYICVYLFYIYYTYFHVTAIFTNKCTSI